MRAEGGISVLLKSPDAMDQTVVNHLQKREGKGIGKSHWLAKCNSAVGRKRCPIIEPNARMERATAMQPKGASTVVHAAKSCAVRP
jgi:hypothetical protein